MLKISLVVIWESIEDVMIQAFGICGWNDAYKEKGVGWCLSDTSTGVKENEESGKYVPNKGTR